MISGDLIKVSNTRELTNIYRGGRSYWKILDHDKIYKSSYINQPLLYQISSTQHPMLPFKFSNQPPEQIISIYGFDKIGDHFILHFEHNDGTKSWGSVEFAKQLIPELTRGYLSHPAHSHLHWSGEDFSSLNKE